MGSGKVISMATQFKGVVLTVPDILKLEHLMFQRFGNLRWWPGETLDEIFLGAILTQNTSWNNVMRALDKLRAGNNVNIGRISQMDVGDLAELIRSSGYHNQKAARIREISLHIVGKYGSLEQMRTRGREEVAGFLKGHKGIGPETLSALLLYVMDFPEFVIDAYTVRVLTRMGFVQDRYDPQRLSSLFVASLDQDIQRLKNIHGMFVELAKRYCMKTPKCCYCPLKGMCAYGKQTLMA